MTFTSNNFWIVNMHKQARGTPAIRAEIKQATGHLAELVTRFKVSISKWKLWKLSRLGLDDLRSLLCGNSSILTFPFRAGPLPASARRGQAAQPGLAPNATCKPAVQGRLGRLFPFTYQMFLAYFERSFMPLSVCGHRSCNTVGLYAATPWQGRETFQAISDGTA